MDELPIVCFMKWCPKFTGYDVFLKLKLSSDNIALNEIQLCDFYSEMQNLLLGL